MDCELDSVVCLMLMKILYCRKNLNYVFQLKVYSSNQNPLSFWQLFKLNEKFKISKEFIEDEQTYFTLMLILSLKSKHFKTDLYQQLCQKLYFLNYETAIETLEKLSLMILK